MQPSPDRRIGLLGGLAGVIFGGLSWLVISGIVIGAPLVWGLSLAAGLGLWIAARHAFAARPERWGTILGVVMLSILLVNALLLDPVWERIPDRLLGVTTGRGQAPLLQIRFTLGLLAALALAFIARDFQKEP
ncbi:MAG: hypothetical protein ACREMW_09665 [Gemmatimonadales bacterium]